MSSRADELRRRYGFQTWSGNDVGDERVFFRDYCVRSQDIPVWHVVSRRRVLLPTGIWLDRASWMQPGDPWQRLLLVESYECRSRDEAQELLAELLAQFQMPPALVAVADGRGGNAFADPQGANGLFVLGNVVARFGSGSAAPAPATAVADHLRTLMAARPPLRPAGVQERLARPRVAHRRTRTVVGAPTPIDVAMATRARAPRAGAPRAAAVSVEPDTYLKVFSRHGEVRADEDDRLVFVPDSSGETELELFDVHADGADAVRMTVEVDEPS
jgi:hypothetical protein